MATDLTLYRLGTGRNRYWAIMNKKGYIIKRIPSGSLLELVKAHAILKNKKVRNSLRIRVSNRFSKEFKNAGILTLDKDGDSYNYGSSVFYTCRTGMREVIGFERPKKIYFRIIAD